MTQDPIEKAKELVEAYYPVCHNTDAETLQYEYAKQCALIATDYLIEETYYEIKNDSRKPLSHREFWQQVKQEIQNL